MFRRILIVMTVAVLVGVVLGCSYSKEQMPPASSVVASDARLMLRDAAVVLGLNRNGCYNRYETPSYVDGH